MKLLEEIDELLALLEDISHGEEGKRITEMRRRIQTQLRYSDKEEKKPFLTEEDIDSVLQTYLPDDYYEDLRKKLIPKIKTLASEKANARIAELEKENSHREKIYYRELGYKQESIASLESEVKKLREERDEFVQFLRDKFNKETLIWSAYSNDDLLKEFKAEQLKK